MKFTSSYRGTFTTVDVGEHSFSELVLLEWQGRFGKRADGVGRKEKPVFFL